MSLTFLPLYPQPGTVKFLHRNLQAERHSKHSRNWALGPNPGAGGRYPEDWREDASEGDGIRQVKAMSKKAPQVQSKGRGMAGGIEGGRKRKREMGVGG